MQKICNKYAINMQVYAQNMQLRNMQEYAHICMKYASLRNMQEICKDMQRL